MAQCLLFSGRLAYFLHCTVLISTAFRATVSYSSLQPLLSAVKIVLNFILEMLHISQSEVQTNTLYAMKY